MAPQNSTLLHANAELSTELNHYSPIQKAINHDMMMETCSNTNTDSTATTTHEIISLRKSITKFDRANYEQVENEIPIWICGKPRFVSGITNSTTCSDLIQALIDDELNSSSADVTASRDLNDYVITEKWRDVEQALPGDTKILPIWMAWDSVQYEVKFKLKINKNKAGTKIAGDYSNDNGDANHHHYDIKYKQHRHKRSAAVAQLMKQLIEQGESIKQQLNMLWEQHDGDGNRLKAIDSKKYRNALFDSFLHDSLRLNSMIMNDEAAAAAVTDDIVANQHNDIVPANVVIQSGDVDGSDDRQLHDIDTTSPTSNDELFLMIDNGTDDGSGGGGGNSNDNNVHVEYRQYYLNKKLDLAIAAAKVSVNSSTPVAATNATQTLTSIPRKLEFDARRQNYFNKRLIKHLCENINQRQMQQRHNRRTTTAKAYAIEKRTSHEIARLMNDLQRLTDHEEQLMKQLSTTCERYRNQNNKYMTNLRLKLCIDEVQHSLDVYAKKIIDNELELHEIQAEIKRKYDRLFNLTKKTELFNNSIDDSDNTFNASYANDKSLII